MDVQADRTGLRPDPDATAVFRQPLVGGQPQPAVTGQHPAATGQHPAVTRQHPVAGGQGQLFADSYPTYADTDQFPAVGSGRSRRTKRAGRTTRDPAPARWLRLTVALVALVVVGAGAALGLVKAGVIGKTSPGSTAGGGTGTTQQHPSGTAPTAALVRQVSTGTGSATYRVDIAAYAVTVKTTTGRAWVSIGSTGKTPAFQGIVPPNASHKEILLGPAQVEVGAGGTSVVVTSGHRSTTLTPPSAPFDYQFVTKG